MTLGHLFGPWESPIAECDTFEKLEKLPTSQASQKPSRLSDVFYKELGDKGIVVDSSTAPIMVQRGADYHEQCGMILETGW